MKVFEDEFNRLCDLNDRLRKFPNNESSLRALAADVKAEQDIIETKFRMGALTGGERLILKGEALELAEMVHHEHELMRIRHTYGHRAFFKGIESFWDGEVEENEEDTRVSD